jgi:hypothetical protein
MKRCTICKKEFPPYQVFHNGEQYAVDSTECRECRANKEAEFDNYPKPPQTGKKP